MGLGDRWHAVGELQIDSILIFFLKDTWTWMLYSEGCIQVQLLREKIVQNFSCNSLNMIVFKMLLHHNGIH